MTRPMPVCTVCRVTCPRGIGHHLGTARHKRAVTPRCGRVRRIRPSTWHLATSRDPLDDVSPEALEAAERWAVS